MHTTTLLQTLRTHELNQSILPEMFSIPFSGYDRNAELRHRPGSAFNVNLLLTKKWLPVHRQNPLRFPGSFSFWHARKTGALRGTLGSRQLVLWTCDICHNSNPNETNHWLHPHVDTSRSGVLLCHFTGQTWWHWCSTQHYIYIYEWSLSFCKYIPLQLEENTRNQGKTPLLEQLRFWHKIWYTRRQSKLW